MTELKPCPFCKSGGDPRPSADDWGHKIIRCEYCGATAPGAQWNNRPTTGRARDLYEKRGLKELTEEQKTSNLEHNTGIEARTAPALPEGYREDEDGDLWTDEEVMPTALAYMEEDGSLAFNFTNYNASESAALIIWLQRGAR